MTSTLFKRWRRRIRHHARHSDTFLHPVVIYMIIAVLIILAIALVGYTFTVR
ncbi:hypothetical protein BH09ACT7_BH09ACT7_25130 [soil metagenome]